MEILILNGPNLNLLGQREPEIYGNTSFESFLEDLKQEFPQFQLRYFQSNIEGELVNHIQEAGLNKIKVVFNPGAYSHTSIALRDAIKGSSAEVIEVHLSNIHARESFRHTSYTGGVSQGLISGFGLNSYRLALSVFGDQLSS